VVSGLLVRKMMRDLFQRKLALAALIGIVTIGVGCFTGMTSLFRDLNGSRERYYRNQRLADFTVDLKRAPQWAVREVATLPNVREVRGRASVSVRIDLENHLEPIGGTAISMPPERVPVINDVLLRSGGWFSHADAKECVLNHQFAEANDLRPGDRIPVLLLDKLHHLLVVGTAMSPEFVYLIPSGGGLAPDPSRFGVLYLPERFMQESCDLDGAYNQLVGLAYENSRPALDRTLTLIEDRLDAYGVTNTTPFQEQPSVRFLADELRGLGISSKVLPAVFLGVAALVLNVLMSRLVAQQRSVVGTLRAVGYSAGAVFRHYVGYGVLIGALGGATGAVLGAWLQGQVVNMYRQFFALPSIEAHFYPDTIALGFLVSIGFAVLGTIKGVKHAVGLAPAEAMRPPPPERGGKVLPERVGFFWRPLPFRWKMILRAVFRNPFRSGVGVLAAVISTALVVSTLSLMVALDYLMHYEFAKVAHQDITVSLRDPEARRAAAEMEDLPAVGEAEGQLAVVCDLSNGPHRKRTGVTGLPPHNRLYTPLDSEGQPIVVPDEGLVLSEKLADILHVAPGDEVRLRPLIGLRQEVTAPVVATVQTFLGISAYAHQAYLSRLLGEEHSANQLFGKAQPGGPMDDLLAELKKRPTVVGVGERTRALSQMEETFGKTMGTTIGVMVLFAGLVAFGSVLNAALVSLSERQREVGTLRVLGYTPRQIGTIFSGESLVVNGAGVLLGLGAGVVLTHLLALAYNTELYRFPVIIRPSRLLLAAALMWLFVFAAQVITHRMIRSIRWLDVLKVKE
jgi:putative ABC transport system permease protein